MKYFFVAALITGSLLFTSCGGDETTYDEQQEDHINTVDYDEFSKELQDLEAEINASNPPNQELMKSAVTKFQDFAGYFPEDAKAPEYLLKASDLAYNTKQYQKSIKILDRIINEYPGYERMEDVMFNKASHLDFEMRDTTRAKQAYQEFIDKYPNSELVDDATSRIQNIRYSADELIELFQQQLEAENR